MERRKSKIVNIPNHIGKLLLHLIDEREQMRKVLDDDLDLKISAANAPINLVDVLMLLAVFEDLLVSLRRKEL